MSTYTNALQLFLDRLNYKHSIKGYSFLDMSKEELDDILLSEFEEWRYSGPEELSELCDIMVACVILIEKIIKEAGK